MPGVCANEASRGRPGLRALEASVRAWPGLAMRDCAAPPTIAELDGWARAAGATLRVASVATGVRYEDAIEAGTIPTREGSWHDVFNVLAFVRFARAKPALHRRVAALRRARHAGPPGLRGRRSREEDALTLLDECALLIGGSAPALARLHEARTHGDVSAVDAVVREEGLSVACFGHALLEHVVLARPPIGAGLVPLELAAREGTTDAALDRALCEAIERGTFDAPRLSPTVPWPDPIVDAWVADQPAAASPRTCSIGSAGSSR